MWKCDRCGEQIEDQFDSCWKCVAMPEEQETISPPVTRRRPAGITVLAMLVYLNAACSLFAEIVYLFGPTILSHLDKPRSSSSLSHPLIAAIVLLGSALISLLANGLWRLKNWARLVTAGFCALDLVYGGPTFLAPLEVLIPSGPGMALLNRLFSFLLVLYLFSPGVRDAFAPTAPLRRWLLPAAAALGLFSLGLDLYRSGPEIRAIRWHMRHGDRASVNGVSFPIYYWYAPGQKPDRSNLGIFDRPGPLRSGDEYASIQIEGYREDEGDLSIEQLVDRKIAKEQLAGYTDVNRFQLQVEKESMGCARENYLTFSAITIYCYGDGPIYSIRFSGGNQSLDRFTRMMAEAR